MTAKKPTDIFAAANELRERTKTLTEQANALAREQDALEKRLRSVKATRNLPPRGAAYVGDEGPTSELMAVVAKLLAEHVLTFQELLDATGARPNRIKGVIMRLQREGTRVVNLGTDTRALWFAPSPEVWARLQTVARARKKKA